MNGKSIAILPFNNLSSDPENEYFSDGITEEIILALSKSRGLKVTARTSSFVFKGQNVDVREIGQKLGVATVLEGSVRKAGQKIRISVQLNRTSDGFQMWSEKFDRELEDIFALQDEISLLVADKIRENFGHIEVESSLSEEESTNIDAYDFYLKGRFEQLKWTNDALDRAIGYYKKSIAIDPKNTRAYYGIVLCYIYQVFWSSGEKDVKGVYEYLESAAGLNRHSIEYFHAKASVEMMIEWNFATAIDDFRELLILNPNNAEALEAIAGTYIMVGEFQEALIHIDRALELNPLSLNHTFMKGNILYFSGKYEEAIEQMDKVLLQDPKWMFAIQLKAAALILTNKVDDLEELLDDYSEIHFMKHYQTLYSLYYGHSLNSYELPFQAEETIHPWQLYFYSLEENFDVAFDLLEFGLEKKFGKYICFAYDPFLKKLKSHPRFESVTHFIPEKLPLLSSAYPKDHQPRALITDPIEREGLMVKLNEVMNYEKAYLDAELSLKKLASTLETTPNKLSWLINEEQDGNFNDYVNGFRLEHFKQLAIRPENQNFTLLGLALDSGFSSKSTFNEYFKRKMGMSPRAWLKEQKNQRKGK